MHTDFIISDIFEILDDAIMSSSGISHNISEYPLCEYILQSVFLRLTGYQEQKLKCILWERASYDFEFRYKYLNGHLNVGECSNLGDKDKVYNALVEFLKENGHEFPFPNEDETNRQISEIRNTLKSKFEATVFKKWLPREYSRFIEYAEKIKYTTNGYFTEKGIFNGKSV